MTLWNIIRDFFVQYVFGGNDSLGNNYPFNTVGQVFDFTEEYGEIASTNEIMFYINNLGNGGYIGVTPYVCMGDWLSTTATIITLVGLFIAITLLIISLFKWIVRLVSLRG